MALMGCSSSDQVVARVNGEDLNASVLMRDVEAIQTAIESDTDAALEAYMQDTGTTVDEWWNGLIEYYAKEMCVTQKCDELGITVSDDELEDGISQLESYMGISTDEELAEYYEGNGLTEEEFKAGCTYSILQQKLYAQEVDHPEATDELIQEYGNTYYASYASTRSSYIYFADGSYDEAYKVLNELKENPKADFAEYAKKYSQDETSAENGGDIGWTLLFNGMPSAYSEVLDELEVGEIYDELVVIDDGYYIIKMTDSYVPTVDDGGTLDLTKMPTELYEQLEQDTNDYLYQVACDNYVDDLYDAADIEILVSSYYDLKK